MEIQFNLKAKDTSESCWVFLRESRFVKNFTFLFLFLSFLTLGLVSAPSDSFASLQRYGDLMDSFYDLDSDTNTDNEVANNDVCGMCHFSWSGGAARGHMAMVYLLFDASTMDGGLTVEVRNKNIHPGVAMTFDDIAANALSTAPLYMPGYPDKDGDGCMQLYHRSEVSGMVGNPADISAIAGGGGNTGALPVIPACWDTDDNDAAKGSVPWGTGDSIGHRGTTNDSDRDTTPPAKITNFSGTTLSNTALNFDWSASGDDGTTGLPYAYDLRYTTDAILTTYNGIFTAQATTHCGGTCNPRDATHWLNIWDNVAGTGINGSEKSYLPRSGGEAGVNAGTNWNAGEGNPLMRALWEPIPSATYPAKENYTLSVILNTVDAGVPNYTSINAVANDSIYWAAIRTGDGVMWNIIGAFDGPYGAAGVDGWDDNYSPVSNIIGVTAGPTNGASISGASVASVGNTSSEAFTINGNFGSALTAPTVKLYHATGGTTPACSLGSVTSTAIPVTCDTSGVTASLFYDIEVYDNAGSVLRAVSVGQMEVTSGGGDVTPPDSMGAITHDSGFAGYVTNGDTFSSLATDVDGTITACDFSINGGTGYIESKGGGASPFTCTSTTALTGLTEGSINLRVKGSSPGGSTESAILGVYADVTGPVISGPTKAAGSSQCTVDWAGTVDAGVGGVTYDLRYNTVASPGPAAAPGDCTSGVSAFTGSATSYVHGTLNAGDYYSYRICATDLFGFETSSTVTDCVPTSGPSTSAQAGANAAPDLTTNAGSSFLSSSFALISAGGSAVNVTGITVNATLSGLADADFAGGISLYLDNGTTAGQWDASDTAVTNGTGGTLSSGTVTFGSVNEATIDGTPTEYVIKATLIASPSADGTASFNVSAIASTQGTGSSDTGESTLSLDTVAPNTVVLSSPALSTWFAANQSVTLTEQDTAGTNNTGVASTQYCMDDDTVGCTPSLAYGASIDVTCPAGQVCEREVGFRSTDNVTNLQTTVYQEPIWIDKQGPSISSFIITGSSSSNCAMSWSGSSDNGVGTIAATGSIWRHTSTAQGCTGTEVDASAIKGASTSDDTTVPGAGTYYYTFCLDDTLANTGTTEISCSAQDATTTGTSNATTAATPGFSYVKGGETEVELGTFKISTTDAADTVTAISLSFTGADGDYAAASVKVFLDANKDGIKDAGETTQIGATGSVSGLAVSISGFSVNANLNNEYVIVANIAATPASADGTNLQAKSVGTAKTNGATVWSNTDAYDGAVTVDKTNATGTATITDDISDFNADNLVNITITCADPTAGCAEMRVSNSSTYADSGWESVANKTDWPLTDSEGTQTVYVWYKDNAGNVSSSGGGDASDSTYIDKTAPSGIVTINGTHEPYTNSATLDSTISGVTDGAGSGCVNIETSQNGSTGWASVGNCTGPINTWTHGCAEGTCDIFVQFTDSVGNVSGNFSDTTIYDTTQPSATTDPADSATDVAIGKLITVNFSNGPIDCTTVTANTTVSISGAGCQPGNLTKDSCNDTAAVFSHPVFGTGASCTIDVTTGVKDKAGNALSPAVSNSFSVSSASESTPPNFSTGTGETISGADKGNGSTVTISFKEATDPAEAGSTAQVDIKYDVCQTQTSGGCDGGSFTANAASNVAGVGTNATITQDVTGLNEGEIYYFRVKAKDQSANVTIHDTEIKAIPYDRTLGFTGYNMISVPGEGAGGIVFSSLLGDDMSTVRVYSYSGGYSSATSSTAVEGQGYWALNRSGTPVIDIDSDSPGCGGGYSCYTPLVTTGTPDTSVAVVLGWNLIGNPCLTNLMGSSSVNNADVLNDPGYIDVTYNLGTMSYGNAVTNNYIKNTVYRWNGTNYSDAPNLVDGSGVLTPWSGFWFFVRDDKLTDIRYNCGTQ